MLSLKHVTILSLFTNFLLSAAFSHATNLQCNRDWMLSCCKSDCWILQIFEALEEREKMGFMKVCELYKEFIDVQDKYGDTPIHYAATSTSSYYQRSDLLPYLISLTKNPNAPNFMNQTPLHAAIAKA